MKNYFTKAFALIVLLSAFGFISNALAFEIITKEDIKQGIIVNIDLIKTADNAIILFDSSSTMNKPFKETGMSRYDIAKKALMERNEYFPDLGYNFGLYLYTPWKEVYPAQKYNRDKFAKALESLPEKATGANFPLGLDYFFPDPHEILSFGLDELGITHTRQATIKTVAQSIFNKNVFLTANQSFETFYNDFSALKGIGDWTIHYVAMRGLGMIDSFPATDLGVIKALSKKGRRPSKKQILAMAQNWRPYRSYATLCFWNSLE